MAATDAPATLSELQTDFLEKLKEVTGNTATNTIVTRFLNQALLDIHSAGKERWWWQERRATIVTKAPYTTGTVAITQGDTAVVGTSTAWATNDAFGLAQAGNGDKLQIGSTTDVYTISGTPSATALTLGSRFTGSTQTAASYACFQDEYAMASDFGDVIDARFFNDDRTIRLIGPQDFYHRYTRNYLRQAIQYATLIELGPSGSTALRRRVVFGPAPDQAYTVPYRYYTTNLAVSSAGAAQVQLSATSDEPIIPIRWRQGLIWKALELWFLTRQRNADLSTRFKARYDELMLRARESQGPADDRLRIMPASGQSVRPRMYPFSTRLSTGTAWDEMRY